MDDKRINLEPGEQLDKQFLAEQEAVDREQQEASSLLESSGEGEVVDITEQTLAWFNSLVRWAREHDREWHEGNDEAVKTIRALIRQPRTVSRELPKIVCLCGSTRFTEKMLIKQWELTKQGCIVVSWCALPDSYFAGKDRFHIGDQEGVKVIIDELHKRKIDLADEVFVLNVGGYIGESTRSEINYAETHGKKISYLEPLAELGIEVKP